jgi:uncharacterized membrane protein
MKVENITDAVAATPPAGVVVASIFGIPIQDWVLYLNLFYIILVIAWKIRSIYKEKKHERKRGCS